MKTFCFVLAFFSWQVQAGDIGLNFKDVPISQFAEAVVKGILAQDYVLSPEAKGNDSKVTLSVRNLDIEGVKITLGEVLRSVGLQVADRRGVLYIEKRNDVVSVDQKVIDRFSPVDMVSPGQRQVQLDRLESGEEPHIYFPKFRGSDYLALAVRAAGARLVDGSVQHQQFPVQQMGQFSNPYAMQQQQQQQQQQLMAQDQSGKASSSLWRDVLVYTGKPETLQRVDKLLAQLDRPSIAVQLRGAVLEVSDSSENIRSLSGLLTMLSGRLGLTLGGAGVVGNSATLKDTNLSAILSAVDGDSRFRYLSEPSLRVLEGETAKLIVGQDVPVRGAVQVDKIGNSVQSIEYRTAGIVFEVTPTVYESMLRLKIGQQISSFTTTTTSGIDSPTMLKREASTVVQAEDGEIIAIAGLDESRETSTASGLSFLPSFMQSKSNNKSRSQVLLLLEVKKISGSAI